MASDAAGRMVERKLRVLDPLCGRSTTLNQALMYDAAGMDRDYPSGETQALDVVNADTVRAAEFFRPETFDVVVADAPYGVPHGSRTAAKGLARRPTDLLAEAAPVWAGLLRPGDAPYDAFRHRVDQSIQRDILVACTPGRTA